MNRTTVIIIAILAFAAGLSSWSFVGTSGAAQKEPIATKLFRHIGSHVEGGQSLFNVYCDSERGNLIYSYLVAVGNMPSTNMVVLEGGCKNE